MSHHQRHTTEARSAGRGIAGRLARTGRRVLPVAGLMLASLAAHAEWRVTAFGDSPGFEQIMAADYRGAATMLATRDAGLARYARHANLCVARLKLARTDEAVRSCERALSAVPGAMSSLVPSYRRRSEILTHLYSNRGVVRAVRGDLFGARADFEYALRLDADNVNARRNLEEVAGQEVALRSGR